MGVILRDFSPEGSGAQLYSRRPCSASRQKLCKLSMNVVKKNTSLLQRFDLVRLAQIFVAQQGNRHVAVLPHKVMELAQVEFIALC
jgi:hypothetical protein